MDNVCNRRLFSFPAKVEFRSYGGVWHNAEIAFVEKYTLISWFSAILGV